MNSVNLMGTICTDLIEKQVSNNNVVNFLLTVQTNGISDSFSIEAWGKTAEFISSNCSKGSVISLSGSLKRNTWIDEGKTREKVKVIAQLVNKYSDSLSLEDIEEDDDYSEDPF